MRQKGKRKQSLSSWGSHSSGQDGEFASKQMIRFPIKANVLWLDTILERVIWEELLEKWTFELRCGGEEGVSHAREK